MSIRSRLKKIHRALMPQPCGSHAFRFRIVRVDQNGKETFQDSPEIICSVCGLNVPISQTIIRVVTDKITPLIRAS